MLLHENRALTDELVEATSFTFSGLSPGILYEVSVAALNENERRSEVTLLRQRTGKNRERKVVVQLKVKTFYHTRCITPKRVTTASWRGPSSRHCIRATRLLLKKYRSLGEALATMCPILSARDLNLKPPAPGTNALPLDQLAVLYQKKVIISINSKRLGLNFLLSFTARSLP